MRIGKWVLICVGNGSNAGKMVAKPGRKNSYTDKLQGANIYNTKVEAEKDACGNEYAKEIEL